LTRNNENVKRKRNQCAVFKPFDFTTYAERCRV